MSNAESNIVAIDFPELTEREKAYYPDQDFRSNLVKLDKLHRMASHCGCSWTLHFYEAEGHWEVELTSPAPSECLSMRDTGVMGLALDQAIEFLEKIVASEDEYAKRSKEEIHTVPYTPAMEKERARMGRRLGGLTHTAKEEMVKWWRVAKEDYSSKKKISIPVAFCPPIEEPVDLVERTHAYLDELGVPQCR